MLLALTRRSFERARGLLAAMIVLLCGFHFLLAMIAGELQRTNTFALITAIMPPAVQQMAGGMMLGSFTGFAAFAFFHPVIVIVFCEAAIYLASEPAWEVESGLVDLTLARAIPRSLPVTRSVLVTVVSLAAVSALMAASARIAGWVFAPVGSLRVPLVTTVRLASNLGALAAWFGALALLAASVTRRRSVAVGAAGVTAIGLYLVNVYADVSPRASWLRPLLPFHYFNTSAMLTGAGVTWGRDVSVLLATAALMVAAAYRLYAERDL